MLFSGVISMICLLWKEYKRNEAEEILVCLLAFATLGVSGMTALILYWVYSIYWYDMVFQAGIFLYTSILFWHLLQKHPGTVSSGWSSWFMKKCQWKTE